MNWGKGIALGFTAFAALIITLVYKSTTTKFELVTKNYYSEELAYQEKIDGSNNAFALSDQLKITQDTNVVVIQLPSEMRGRKVEGTLWFYFPSDAGKDLNLPLTMDADGRQVIGKSLLGKGAYKLMVRWKNEQRHFYTDTEIHIQ